MTEYGLGHESSRPRITVVRVTHWPDPDAPMTLATTESDLKVTPIEMIEQLLGTGAGFFTYEMFAAPVDDIALASAECARRAAEAHQDERNMAIAYLWYATACKATKPDGKVISDKPAPLTREQVAWVFRSLSYHPDYRGQQIHLPLEDGTIIEMAKGQVLPA